MYLYGVWRFFVSSSTEIDKRNEERNQIETENGFSKTLKLIIHLLPMTVTIFHYIYDITLLWLNENKKFNRKTYQRKKEIKNTFLIPKD